MRIAVSGSHSVGKSTLIAGFLGRHHEYAHEPEAFEVLADDVELTESGAPTPCLRRALLDDRYELFADGRPPRVVALPAAPEEQLAKLSRLVRTLDG